MKSNSLCKKIYVPIFAAFCLLAVSHSLVTIGPVYVSFLAIVAVFGMSLLQFEQKRETILSVGSSSSRYLSLRSQRTSIVHVVN